MELKFFLLKIADIILLNNIKTKRLHSILKTFFYNLTIDIKKLNLT